MPPAKLLVGSVMHLCRINNISAGGFSAEVAIPQEVGTSVCLQLADRGELSGKIVWTRRGMVGVKFDQNADLRTIFGKQGASAPSPRPPRVEINCSATIGIGKFYYKADVRDISLSGMKIAIADENCVGRTVNVTIDSLRPVRGQIRWYNDGYAGIAFDEPFDLAELGGWLARRLEVAALRTAAPEGATR